MEKIIAINEMDGSDGDGFEVVTDAQTIRLSIDNNQCCCESWGHFWCNDETQYFIGAELREVTLTNAALNTEKITAKGADRRDEGDIMFVNLVTDRGVLQFVAYNSHNGYYGHTASVVSTQLIHSVCL